MTSHTTRRNFVSGLAACGLVRAARPAGKRPVILLRSGWQTVNIGDIGHTAGALSLLSKYFPEAQVTLWPNRLTDEDRDMLLKGYPGLKIADGSLDKANRPMTPEHGSSRSTRRMGSNCGRGWRGLSAIRRGRRRK